MAQAEAKKKLRVSDLAKELGVTSKAVLEKCKAEGLPIEKHMHVLSVGQEETIREWFSEGPHQTAVETAAPVDLAKVKKPSKPRGSKKKKAAEEAPPPAEPIAEPAPPAAETAQTAPPAVAAEAPSTVPAPAETPPIEVRPAAEAPAAEAAPPESPGQVVEEPAHAPTGPLEPPAVEEKPAPAVAASAPAPEPPPPPTAPAGPQNIPRPAQLRGPTVVRIEKPDYVPRPRPAARGPAGGGVVTGPPPEVAGPRRRGQARTKEEEEEEERAAAKRSAAGGARARINPRRSARDSAVEFTERLREYRDQDLIDRRERLAQATGRTHRAVETRREGAAPARPAGRREKVRLREPIVLKEFCRQTGIRFDQIVPKLVAQGLVAGLSKTIDGETAQLLAMEFGVELTVEKALSPLDVLRDKRAQMDRKHVEPRPPVVTILGHVDHGKTSLLDRIRETKVAAGEAGGITQHIGAYRVRVKDRYVTFLDTPGHAAFTAMRARGANLTDVVVLVVAADDGVMPQTVEAINHARAAKVPIVVALNKIDLPGVDVNKIYGQLSEHQLTPQAWGGDTDVIHTSATTGEGIDELLVHLAAMSDLMDLRADTRVPAFGTVIEARMKEGAGAVARVMVREGRLREGAVVVCGPSYGKVRAMTDEVGKRQKSAGPATPVELAGLSAIPAAGDELYEVDTLQEAKAAAEEIQRQRREAELAQLGKPTDLTSLLASATGEEVPSLNVILKADVQGSVDVLRKTLEDIPRDQVRLNILHSGVGAISDGDVMLAAASKAIVIGFTVIAEPSAQKLAQEHGVELRFYRVIYEVDDDIRKALAGLLAPAESIESRGRAEVRQVFNVGKVGRIAGCFVRDGTVARNHMVRVVRDSVVIKERSALASLRRFKDDVREVRAGLECGMRLDGFDDLKPGDVIESYEVVQVERTL